MKIHYVERKYIDLEKWDSCLKTAKNGLPYAYSWYLDIVSPNWAALVNDDYTTIMPLTWRQKMWIPYICQPFFVQQLGIFSQEQVSSFVVHDFLRAIPQKFRYIDMYLNEGNPVVSSLTYKSVRRVNYILSLNDSYNSICFNYGGNVKRNLRKSLCFTMPIVDNANANDIVNLYQATISPKTPHLQIQYYERVLKPLVAACQAHGIAQTHSIYGQEGNLICGLFLIKSHLRLINFIATSSEEGRKNSQMFRLLDAVIRKHSETIYMLDFEGSMIPSIASFYRGFGAKECHYWHVVQNNLPFPLNLIKK